MRYEVNDPQVISETVGGETIIVNLASGHYFNLQQTAVDVWEGVLRGDSVEQIVAGLSARYSAPDGEIPEAVDSLLAEFAVAELVRPVVDDDRPPAGLPAPPAGRELPPFERPSFTTFTDMQDIILLDPVHEVDARGWPHAATGA